ncbi:MAG TPA: tetratricopeptide repeat protein, partial [Sedimentisphaerales bacterium]|nr:tetratricopeptide repeat protein [Sedimentisphaerales bacterium]
MKPADSLMLPQGGSAVQSSQKWIRRLAVAGLILAMIAAYSRISRNEFVNFDDYTYITRNRHVNDGLSFEGVKWAFTEYHSSNWHPVTWLSHMLDVELFGMWAGGHHLVSLGIHILNSLLLLWFLCSATGRFWPSLFVAGLFALHPLRVESVAWASERKDVLSVFFWMATMMAYSFYVKKTGWRRYAVVVLLFALGLMSKPMLVTLPIVLLLLDWWPFERVVLSGRHRGRPMPLLRLAAEKLPLLAMSAVSALVTIDAQQGAVAALDVVGFSTRFTNAAISYWRYLGQMIWPAGLAVLYPYVNRPEYLLAAAALLLLAGATVAAVRWRMQFRYILTGWLWYLIALLPVIGLIQVGAQSHADRYTYLPLTGIFIIISWGASSLARRVRAIRIVIPAAAVAILVILGILTWRQTGYWKDSVTLFERTTAVTEDNHVAMTNLGNALIDIGEPDRAMEQFQKSLALAPRQAQTLTGIGKVLFDRGELDASWQYYKMAVDLKPDLKDAQLNAG